MRKKVKIYVILYKYIRNEKNIICIGLAVLLEHSGLINPGGSLGSDSFKVAYLSSVEELKSELIEFYGYDVTNNLFFKDYLKGKKVAELGCGHGFMSLLLSEFVKEVHAFDVDREAIEFANQLKRKFGLENVIFESFGGNDLPVGDEVFDCTISADVIEHVPTPLSYLKEAFRVLKKDGLLFLTTPNGLIAKKNKCIILTHSKHHITEYYPNELSDMLSNSGFEVLETFSSKNISGGGYHINTFKKIAIKTLCRIGLFGSFSILKNILVEKRKGKDRPTNNAFQDFRVTKRDLGQINSRNCDAIFIIAKKIGT